MKERIELARSVAAEAGRDPDSILISTACVAVAATNEEWYQRSLASAAKRFDREPEKIEGRWDELGYPIGTSEKVQELLTSWEEIGVQRY